jgi:hypothetical protein
MKIDGWKYYNHAAIPTIAPHENPYMDPIEDGTIWNIDGGIPLLARWTSNFDCNIETHWWYVIKDCSFDINSLKAKRRYEITKGIKNFEVVEIDPVTYAEELYAVRIAAFSAYPEKYRPSVNKESFISSVNQKNRYVCIGAFQRETNELSGYAMLSRESDEYVSFDVLKTKPEFEKMGVNAALVNGVLNSFDLFLANGGYICDGTRSINHESSFQDYLEKYFGFRKAYCKLHIKYNPKMACIIKLVYPFRKLLLNMDGIGIIHSLNGVLRMEEIVRTDNE